MKSAYSNDNCMLEFEMHWKLHSMLIGSRMNTSGYVLLSTSKNLMVALSMLAQTATAM